MAVEHEQDLIDFAQRAAKLAEQIHQEWGSGLAPGGGFQVRVNVTPPKRGPDPELQKIEGLLGDVINTINTYLRPRPER